MSSPTLSSEIKDAETALENALKALQSAKAKPSTSTASAAAAAVATVIADVAHVASAASTPANASNTPAATTTSPKMSAFESTVLAAASAEVASILGSKSRDSDDKSDDTKSDETAIVIHKDPKLEKEFQKELADAKKKEDKETRAAEKASRSVIKKQERANQRKLKKQKRSQEAQRQWHGYKKLLRLSENEVRMLVTLEGLPLIRFSSNLGAFVSIIMVIYYIVVGTCDSIQQRSWIVILGIVFCNFVLWIAELMMMDMSSQSELMNRVNHYRRVVAASNAKKQLAILDMSSATVILSDTPTSTPATTITTSISSTTTTNTTTTTVANSSSDASVVVPATIASSVGDADPASTIITITPAISDATLSVDDAAAKSVMDRKCNSDTLSESDDMDALIAALNNKQKIEGKRGDGVDDSDDSNAKAKTILEHNPGWLRNVNRFGCLLGIAGVIVGTWYLQMNVIAGWQLLMHICLLMNMSINRNRRTCEAFIQRDELLGTHWYRRIIYSNCLTRCCLGWTVPMMQRVA